MVNRNLTNNLHTTLSEIKRDFPMEFPFFDSKSKPKSSFRHLKRGIQDFHMSYVLVPADKAANNVVVV